MANIEALKQLRRVVEEAPDQQFNMRTFQSDVTPCRTTRCAAGHAAFDPWHRQNTPINKLIPIVVHGGVETLQVDHIDGSFPIFEGLADIYGISDLESKILFDLHSIPATKEQVVANIDRLIAGDDPRPYGGIGIDEVDDLFGEDEDD